MEPKTFRGSTLAEVERKVRSELGDVILCRDQSLAPAGYSALYRFFAWLHVDAITCSKQRDTLQHPHMQKKPGGRIGHRDSAIEENNRIVEVSARAAQSSASVIRPNVTRPPKPPNAPSCRI